MAKIAAARQNLTMETTSRVVDARRHRTAVPATSAAYIPATRTPQRTSTRKRAIVRLFWRRLIHRRAGQIHTGDTDHAGTRLRIDGRAGLGIIQSILRAGRGKCLDD
jgi:hypothetical protein